jgi:hypothetical protein
MKKLSFLMLLTLSISSSKAQVSATADSVKKEPSKGAFAYTLYVDGYYRADIAGSLLNNKTSFTNSNNAFKLGMASIKLDPSYGKFSASIDLGIGKRVEEFSYNDKGLAQNIKQAYISYAATDKIKFTVGKWATHVGYELLDAYANRNYSMSYGFSYGPFFHTGIRADIALGGKSAMMIGIAQPTDFVSSSSSDKMIIAQLSTATKDDKLKAYLNYQGGKDKSQFDLVLNKVVTSEFAVNYDGTIAHIAGLNWSSNALYFNYDPTAKVGYTLRTEYFNDSKSAVGVGTSIFQSTFSVNFHLNKFTIIPEVRLDNAKDKAFFSHTLYPTKSAGSFLIAAVYKF